jgi:ribulose-5-phosphate 4-epimerase/fuculose-1-phosphate aldolase
MPNERLREGTPRIDCSQEEWNLRVDLACAYRLVAHFGWHTLIFNHLTARVPGPEKHFLINPFGLMFREVTASNLLKIDLEGNKVLPSPHPVLQAGFVVHRSVHMCREDIVSVMHTHSIAGVAVASQAEGLLPLNLNSMVFHDRIAYHDVEGLTIDTSESERIAGSLGDKTLMILRNHGLLTCGASVAEAFSELYHLETACQIQIAAQSSGARLAYPTPALAKHTAMQRYNEDGSTKQRVLEQYDILWAAMQRWMREISPGFDE